MVSDISEVCLTQGGGVVRQGWPPLPTWPAASIMKSSPSSSQQCFNRRGLRRGRACVNSCCTSAFILGNTAPRMSTPSATIHASHHNQPAMHHITHHITTKGTHTCCRTTTSMHNTILLAPQQHLSACTTTTPFCLHHSNEPSDSGQGGCASEINQYP
jgi:hypothetical protein